MSFPAILRRSISRAAPFATKFIRHQRTIHYSAPATTPFNRSTLSSHLFRAVVLPSGRPHCLCSAGGRRFFCSVYALDDDGISADKKLIQVVQSEIDVVEQSDNQEKTLDAPADFPFAIHDNPGEQTVTLSREYDGETITVEVSMPSLVSGDLDEGGDDDDEEQPTDSSVPLLITVVKKDGNEPYLEFDCSAFPDEIKINGLSLKNPEAEDQLAYEGPDFFDLDENLQKAFHKYLEIRGVTPLTTNFLHEYMIEKDNKEYVRWLKDLKAFVEA